MMRKDIIAQRAGKIPTNENQMQSNPTQSQNEQSNAKELIKGFKTKAHGQFTYEIETADGQKDTLVVDPHGFSESIAFANTQLKKIFSILVTDDPKGSINFLSNLAVELISFLDSENDLETVYKFLSNSKLGNGNVNCYDHKDELFKGDIGLFIDVLTCTLDANYGDLIRKKKFSLGMLFPDITSLVSDKITTAMTGLKSVLKKE
jgi:hypothetical protein